MTVTNGKNTTTAAVEVLTAEVRALMVGSRQVTLSVYRQLDEVEPNEIEPFGRVRDSKDTDASCLYVIGKAEDGGLVRARQNRHPPRRQVWVSDLVRVGWGYPHRGNDVGCGTLKTEERGEQVVHWDWSAVERIEDCKTWGFVSNEARDQAALRAYIALDFDGAEASLVKEWQALPLIVLAGLR